MLAAIIGGLIVLAAGGVVVAQAVFDPDEPRGLPGLTNEGEPFFGTDIMTLSPSEASDLAGEKGYEVRWQIESRQGTAMLDDDHLSFSDEAPTCGSIQASVIADVTIQFVVVIDDPFVSGSEDCYGYYAVSDHHGPSSW